MTRFLFIILLFLNIGPGYAQDKTTLCRLWMRHEPGPDVAYRPGADIYGNAVAPADLGAPVTAIPDVIRIPVTVDLVGRLNQSLPQGMLLEAPVGLAEIYRDGRVLYNGQDVSGAVASLCGEAEEAPLPVQEGEAVQ